MIHDVCYSNVQVTM